MKKFVCEKCGNPCTHICEVYNSWEKKEDYYDSEHKTDYDFGFRQGCIVVKIHCESCNAYSLIVIGEHKGEVFIKKVDRTDFFDADDGALQLVDTIDEFKHQEHITDNFDNDYKEA
jgi:hypothetical protein